MERILYLSGINFIFLGIKQDKFYTLETKMGWILNF